jgi:RHS repeat-associated protein
MPSTNESANLDKQPYKFGGKEYETMHGLNLYDFEARPYDPILGRFLTPDPLAEKYYSVSPYAYTLNNPVNYIDPTGMIVEDPDEIYKNHKQQISKNLDGVNQALKLDGLTKEMQGALKTLAGEYSTMLNEFSSLEKSDQVYKVFGTEGNEGGVYYEKGTVMIGLGDQSIGLVGHELKHAYQFEIGEISFRTDGTGFGSLYDISDETAAYNRERLLGTGVQFIQTPNAIVNGYPLKMNNDNVRSFGLQMNPPAYQTLPNGPININSPEGQHLQKSSFLHGFTGISLSTEISRGLYYSRGFNSSHP